MTATCRTLSEGELAKVRSDGQAMKVRACFIPQQVTLACRSSGSLLSNDAVTYVPITGITAGSPTSVQAGMTGYVSSGSDGSGDLGMIRIKAASGSAIKCARISGIPWSASTYITVVDDYGIWAKLPTLDLTDLYMDDDIQYAGQNTYMPPVPIMGPDLAVPYSAGSIVLDGSNSYCLDGSSITTWTWGIRNGSAVSGSIAASGSGFATLTFPGPGSYVLSLAVTTSNGVTATGHRNLYVYDETGDYVPVSQLTVRSLSGDRDNGGWSAELSVWDGVSLPTVRDRAKVILISDDYYSGSGVAGNFRQVANAEKVLMTGWIATEATQFDRETSMVQLTIQGPHYWLQKATGPSTFLENVADTPIAWTSVVNLTMDKVIHHFLYWRSTAIEVLDVYSSGNTRIIGGMSASIGSIWSQIYDTAETRMLTYIGCDRFGRFFSYIDPQVQSLASRASIPTVIALTTDDLEGKVDIPRTVVNPVALLEVAGLATTGVDVLMYMARAPGSLIYNRFGDNDVNDRLVVSSQDDANALAGMLLAKKNNTYNQVNLSIAQVNHMLDIAPPMYVTLTVSASDTNRGFALNALKILPQRLEYMIKEDTGSVLVDFTGEGETSGIPGYTVEVPQEPIYNFPPIEIPTIEYPISPIPISPIIPIITPILPHPPALSGSACPNDAATNGPYNLFLSGTLYPLSLQTLRTSYSCVIRSNAHTHKTTYQLVGAFQKLVASGSTGSVYANTNDDNWYTVYGLNAAGTRVATGVHNSLGADSDTIRTGYFAPASNQEIKAVEIVLNAAAGNSIASGSWAWVGHFWDPEPTLIYQNNTTVNGWYRSQLKVNFGKVYYSNTGVDIILTGVNSLSNVTYMLQASGSAVKNGSGDTWNGTEIYASGSLVAATPDLRANPITEHTSGSGVMMKNTTDSTVTLRWLAGYYSSPEAYDCDFYFDIYWAVASSYRMILQAAYISNVCPTGSA